MKSLLSPTFAGSNRWGYWFMGGLALPWLADSFWALVLTLPVKKKAAVAGAQGCPAKAGGNLVGALDAVLALLGTGALQAQFRSVPRGCAVIWGVIVIVAFTLFPINLYREVFYPRDEQSDHHAWPLRDAPPAPLGSFIDLRSALPWPSRSRSGYGAAGHQDRRPAVSGMAGFPGSITCPFFDPDDETGDCWAWGCPMSGGASESGEVSWAAIVPGTARAPMIFVQLQLLLHSGRILAPSDVC